jgi:hypothetical protein
LRIGKIGWREPVSIMAVDPLFQRFVKRIGEKYGRVDQRPLAFGQHDAQTQARRPPAVVHALPHFHKMHLPDGRVASQ